MGRKVITVPAAGESEEVGLTGLSIVVASAPPYFSEAEAPKLSFDDPGGGLPIMNRNVWPAPNEFQKVVITGTTESAGDQVTLISYDLCLNVYQNPNIAQTHRVQVGGTFTKAASDAVQGLTEVELADADGNLPSLIYVYVVGGATSGINYAFGADPSQGDGATDAYFWDNDRGHTDFALEPLEIEGINLMLAFNFIATVAGETPTLIITPLY